MGGQGVETNGEIYRLKKVHIYTKHNCPFCTNAKEWLKIRGIPYTETLLESDEDRQAFYEKVGENVRTVPQIYVDDVRVGGFTDLQRNEHLFVEIDL